MSSPPKISDRSSSTSALLDEPLVGTERRCGPTVEALAELSPSVLVPAHCTGWKAVQQLAARMPDAFVISTVGTTIEL